MKVEKAEQEDQGNSSPWLAGADREGSGNWGNPSAWGDVESNESWAWGGQDSSRGAPSNSAWDNSTTGTVSSAPTFTSARDYNRVVRRDFDSLNLDFESEDNPSRSPALDGVPTREWSRLQRKFLLILHNYLICFTSRAFLWIGGFGTAVSDCVTSRG